MILSLILSGLTIDVLTRKQEVKRMYLKYISKSIYQPIYLALIQMG